MDNIEARVRAEAELLAAMSAYAENIAQFEERWCAIDAAFARRRAIAKAVTALNAQWAALREAGIG